MNNQTIKQLSTSILAERQENQFPALKSSARRVFNGRHLKTI